MLPGDTVLAIDGTPLAEWNQIPEMVGASEGRSMHFTVRRGEEKLFHDSDNPVVFGQSDNVPGVLEKKYKSRTCEIQALLPDRSLIFGEKRSILSTPPAWTETTRTTPEFFGE